LITLSRPSPLGLLAFVLVTGGVIGMTRDRSAEVSVEPCVSADGACDQYLLATAGSATGAPPEVLAEDFCRNVGYLCAPLELNAETQLRRWRDFEGTLVVHVPLPEGVDPSSARRMQLAASQGIRAWHDQPFPILTDLRGDRDPHFSVSWTASLGGRQIGVARTRWAPFKGLEVLGIELVTQDPTRFGQPVEPRQLRLTAAHEMGHALGLQHSDTRRDVMYPENTANSMSAQDYRSIEVLYRTEDGTIIRR